MVYWYPIVVALAALVSLPLLFADLGPLRKFHRIIFVVLVLVAALEAWCAYLASNRQSNIVYYNAVFVYTLPILYLYFFEELFHQKEVKKVLFLLGGLFLLFGVIKTLFITPFQEFHDISYIMGSLLIIGACLYFFYSIISRNLFIEMDLLRFPVFWVITFLLFFYASAMLNFASVRFVNTSNFELMVIIRDIINVLGALMYFVFAVSFYLPLLNREKAGINEVP
jgi:drug/metabolite transporter (DMT)-like permease